MLALLPSSRYCSTNQHWRVGMSGVGCFGFGFHTTASVDIDVDPVSDRVLGLGLNAPGSSPAPYVQLSTAPCETFSR